MHNSDPRVRIAESILGCGQKRVDAAGCVSEAKSTRDLEYQNHEGRNQHFVDCMCDVRTTGADGQAAKDHVFPTSYDEGLVYAPLPFRKPIRAFITDKFLLVHAKGGSLCFSSYTW